MWVLIEVILAVGVISAMLSYILPLYESYKMDKDNAIVEQQFNNFKKSIEEIFTIIRDTAVSSCGGYVGGCAGTVPLPSVANSSSGNSMEVSYSIPATFPSRATLVSRIEAVMLNAGCTKKTDNPLVFDCGNFRANSAVSASLNPTNFPVYDVGWIKRVARGDVLVSETIDLNTTLRQTLMSRTQKIYDDVAYALKEYHLRRRIEEADNPCRAGGGLHSADDIYIPWVMQSYTSNVNALCNTSTASVCSCNNINWSGVNQRTSYPRIPPFNGRGMNDAFGFKVCVYALIDSSGNPLSAPNPQAGYTLRPPYRGKVFSTDRADCSTAPSFRLEEVWVYAN